MPVAFMETHVDESLIVNSFTPSFKKWFFTKFAGFTLPQKYAIYPIHTRQNILVSAPTGSGKTLCAFSAILNELIDSGEKNILKSQIHCVYISPLKALSNDIKKNLLEPLEEIEAQGVKTGIRIGLRTGDTTQSEKAKIAKTPPHILITTPESLAIMLSSPKFREHFRSVQWCIVDEIHSLAENKRGVHLSLSLERLQRLSPGMARIGLSATVAPLEGIAQFLVGADRDCKIVDVQFIKEYDFKVLSPVDDLMNSSQAEIHEKTYALMDELIHQHRTTLVFTNTRSATERVVHHLKEKFPKKYTQDAGGETARSLIGAHHGSLSKQHRISLENELKEGKLKAVVCSTSLELGIDIGYIDLVICLGSPKSVARLLQRAGRSGHSLNKKTKCRIIVMDRDDLIECCVMVKSALEKKIDRVHIPKNCLDVLAQHIVGMAVEEDWSEKELYETVKKSYCYKELGRSDFEDILSYLAGEFTSLEDRHVYAKIWRKHGMVGKRGRMTRVIYMTNIGTIPDETSIKVKVGEEFIGTIDESFLERLKPGDIFVLGGVIYQFKYARGATAQVSGSVSRPPTVPSWVSEQLPLSFDLATDVGRFRRLIEEKLESSKKEDIVEFINNYLYVDAKGAEAVYGYMKEQYDFCRELPGDKKVLIEHYESEDDKKIVFHTLFGRRVNDCLSRAVAFSISLTQKRDVEVGINDNGFYVACTRPVNVLAVVKQLNAGNLEKVMKHAIEKSEVYRRRFRHCAARSLMMLRNYLGREKMAGRQQVASTILLKSLMDINPDFSILKEAKREVLEDLMDIENAKEVIRRIKDGEIEIEEMHTRIPSPFAFNLVLQGHLDILKMEDKIEFLKRMHSLVLAKISLSHNSGNVKRDLFGQTEKIAGENAGAEKEALNTFMQYEHEDARLNVVQKRLLGKAGRIRYIPQSAREELIKVIKGMKISDINPDFVQKIKEYKDEIIAEWPKELSDFIFAYLNGREGFSFEKYFEMAEKSPGANEALKKEALIEGIKKIARRQKLGDGIKFDLIESVESGKLGKESREWIKSFLKGVILKYVDDELFHYLNNMAKNI